MRKIFILSVLIISILFICVCPAFAVEINELDVYDFASSVVIDGSNEIVKANLPLSWSWSRYHDNSLQKTASGKRFTYTTQMRYVDNDVITGKNPDGMIIPAEGIPSGLTVSGNFVISFDVTGQTQPYDINWKLQCFLVNKGWGVIDTITLAESTQHGTSAPTVNTMPWSFDTDLLADAYGFYFFLTIDLAGVANESDSTTVTVDTSCSTAQIIIPYSQLYRLQEQTNSTNKLLDSIDSAMKDNGLKLDEVIAGNQEIRDEIDNMVNGDIPPAEVPKGQDKIDDLDNQEGQLRDDAADGLQQGLDMMDDTLDALLTYSFGFFALGMVFELFFQIPFFNVLVSLSLVLGILASFLGIIVSISSAGGGRYSKAKSRHQRTTNSKQGKQGGKS